MYYSKFLIWLLVLNFGLFSVFSAQIYNEDGEFRITVDDSQSKTVFNDDINTKFTFTIENNLEDSQRFNINVGRVSGWDINLEKTSSRLSPGETEQIIIGFTSNSAFDYSPQVVSPDLIKISQKEDYVGNFNFPITVRGENENVSMKFNIAIKPKEELPLNFIPQFASAELSPQIPFQFSITAKNVVEQVRVEVKAMLNEKVLINTQDVFTKQNSYKIYSKETSEEIAPGTYESVIVVRQLNQDGKSAKEWFEQRTIEVIPYEEITSKEYLEKHFFSDSFLIELSNDGNVKSNYVKDVELGSFKRFLLSSNQDYEKISGGIKFNVELERGEEKTVEYKINYLPVYLMLIVIIVVFTYIYIRKASNPLDVENKLYEIVKVKHEGVKSLKVRIGFENLKIDEIDTLKVIFRMPSYLQVKDDSFLLAPPKHALKGRDQYKLIWELKRFEKNDSRILGFTLVNNRGVLGDVKLPPLEFEVKVGGKLRKYYESFPTIKG